MTCLYGKSFIILAVFNIFIRKLDNITCIAITDINFL